MLSGAWTTCTFLLQFRTAFWRHLLLQQLWPQKQVHRACHHAPHTGSGHVKSLASTVELVEPKDQFILLSHSEMSLSAMSAYSAG